MGMEWVSLLWLTVYCFVINTVSYHGVSFRYFFWMRSIIDRLKGSCDFPRLRIGIGRPPGKMDTANFVLRQFNRQEQEELDHTFQTGLEAITILLLEGFNKSATVVNTRKSMEQT